MCNGLVGVTLGDGQPPIGRDLKRHTLFFLRTKIRHECPSGAVNDTRCMLSAFGVFIKTRPPWRCPSVSDLKWSPPKKSYKEPIRESCNSRRLMAIVAHDSIGGKYSLTVGARQNEALICLVQMCHIQYESAYLKN